MNLAAIDLAESIARLAHANQFRRDKRTPYITHVFDVVCRAYRLKLRIARHQAAKKESGTP